MGQTEEVLKVTTKTKKETFEIDLVTSAYTLWMWKMELDDIPCVALTGDEDDAVEYSDCADAGSVSDNVITLTEEEFDKLVPIIKEKIFGHKVVKKEGKKNVKK